jgi:hypothetical protein
MTVEERPIEYDKRACHRREGRETAQREEATTKSFVDLQLRALEVKEAWAKSILVEAEAMVRLMDAKAKSRLLEVESKIMAEDNRIMLTDLATISDHVQRTWIEKKQKMILARDD